MGKILNKRSNGVNPDGTPKIPTSSQIDYGEIAINYKDGLETLSIKSSNNNIVTLPINQQNIKKLLFNDLWLSLPGCNISGENYSYINNIYTYENAIKKYHELLALVDSNYKMIDLGLPSGTRWADRNIGAKNPEDGGLYFQWGDTQGYTADQVGTVEGKKAFTWSDYKFSGPGANDDNPQLTKYCNIADFGKDGFVDNKLVLDLEDDAAYVNMGIIWRMPTKEDFEELLQNTDKEVISIDEDKTYIVKFVNKNDSTKYILIPMTGLSVSLNTSYAWIWTNSVYELCSSAWSTFISDTNNNPQERMRCEGLPIRGIC